MSRHWAFDSFFYHIYPLGMCGAPAKNDFLSLPSDRLEKIEKWIPHLKFLGVNALYLGPVFESSAHGYDTADYYSLDRRLGTNDAFVRLVKALHKANIRVILDGVFHHVGRDFWAFKDLRINKEASAYKDWFSGIDFTRRSPFNDLFSYDGWRGHYDLVKLNVNHPHVKLHLFHAVRKWMEEFDIDGLRLDVADCLDMEFQRELSSYTKSLRPDFWLMGEVIHGDYRGWVNRQTLDSVTNYECYKGLYSSLVDKNYFEIAWSLNRQFGQTGMYQDLPLYNFVDNHDVNRVMSNLKNEENLYPLYCLLFTMPGIPSIYYGSEWGLPGRIENGDDKAVRQELTPESASGQSRHPDLPKTIKKLAEIRRNSAVLKYGGYRELYVNHEQFCFERVLDSKRIIITLNSSVVSVPMELKVYHNAPTVYTDLLNGDTFTALNGNLRIPDVWPNWGRILAAK